jgi:hypothetical protein
MTDANLEMERGLSSPRRRKGWVYLAILVTVLAVLYGLFRLYLHQHRIGLVPADLNVSTIVYANEENWGFGPGGNETGLMVYELPVATAQAISARGLAYFTQADNTSSLRLFSPWRATPIAFDRHWRNYMAAESSRLTESERAAANVPGIANYLNRYGFGIPLDPAIERLVNEIVSSPGSFYGYGRTGIVIVAPLRKRVVFAYAG